MAISQILTLGLGSFGGVRYLPTLGYLSGDAPIPPTPVNPNLGGGGSGYDSQRKIKPKNAVRKLIEQAYKQVEHLPLITQENALKEAVIVEAIQEVQLLEELNLELIAQIIQQIELRLIKQRNDELAAIILLLE
jgi:transcriptional regulator CtsR